MLKVIMNSDQVWFGLYVTGLAFGIFYAPVALILS